VDIKTSHISTKFVLKK